MQENCFKKAAEKIKIATVYGVGWHGAMWYYV